MQKRICNDCKKEYIIDDSLYGEEVCQECWESRCDQSWWEEVNNIN